MTDDNNRIDDTQANKSQPEEMFEENVRCKASETLVAQVDAAFKRNHEKSYNTRYKYWDAATRFANFTGDIFHIKNIRNMDDRHIQAYVDMLIDEDCMINYLKSELSAIRHLHHIVDGKRPIQPKNIAYGVGKRTVVARPGATNDEYKAVREIAMKSGQLTRVMAIDFERHFGCSSNEAHAFRCFRIADAIEKGYLELSQSDGTKGGRTRRVNIITEAQKELLVRTARYIRLTGKTNNDRVVTGREKGAVHKSKAALTRFFSAYKSEIGGITQHDLRRAFAQDVYDLTPGTDAERMAAVCRALGHGEGRQDITSRYVANRHAR